LLPECLGRSVVEFFNDNRVEVVFNISAHNSLRFV
jgi:hypothetical protein